MEKQASVRYGTSSAIKAILCTEALTLGSIDSYVRVYECDCVCAQIHCLDKRYVIVSACLFAVPTMS